MEFQQEVLQRLTCIETKLNNGILANQKDHEKRLRVLEKSLWFAIGALGLLNVVLKFWV